MPLYIDVFLPEILQGEVLTENPFLEGRTFDDAIYLCIEPLHLDEIPFFCRYTDYTSFSLVGREFAPMIRMMVSEVDEHMDKIFY